MKDKLQTWLHDLGVALGLIEPPMQPVPIPVEDPRRRPPGASDVYVIAALARPVDVVIKNLVPDTEAVRAAVRAELADLFQREARPGKLLIRSHINESISAASGEEDHTLVQPEKTIVPEPNELPILGSVEFVKE